MLKFNLYLTIYSVEELRKAANTPMEIEIMIEPRCYVIFKQGKPCGATYIDYFDIYSDSSKLNESEFQKNKELKIRGNNCYAFDDSRFYHKSNIDWNDTMNAIVKRYGTLLSNYNDEHKRYRINSKNHTLIYAYYDNYFLGYRNIIEIDGKECDIPICELYEYKNLRNILHDIYREFTSLYS